MKLRRSTPNEKERRSRDIDEQTERTLGRVLQTGVLAAGAIVLVAGAVFVARQGGDPASFGVFEGQPSSLSGPVAIISNLGSPNASTFIQLGLLVLIATPIARVVLSVYSFARLRDLMYVAFTMIVLAVLAFGLVSGQ